MIDADHRVFEWINGLAGESRALDNVMKLLVSDFFLPVLIALAAFSLWFTGRTFHQRLANQWGFLYAAVGAGLSNLVVQIFNQSFYRPRPFVTLDDVTVLFYRPTDPSFPSNAAAFAFAMAAGVWLTNRRWGTIIGVGALLFVFARVYAGMHFPLDVVAGALLGILTTWFFARALDLIKPVVDWAFRLLRWFHLA
ncbi:MAG: phosphatase PAP2 family protein [Dehalococcoidia bacterium]